MCFIVREKNVGRFQETIHGDIIRRKLVSYFPKPENGWLSENIGKPIVRFLNESAKEYPFNIKEIDCGDDKVLVDQLQKDNLGNMRQISAKETRYNAGQFVLVISDDGNLLAVAMLS